MTFLPLAIATYGYVSLFFQTVSCLRTFKPRNIQLKHVVHVSNPFNELEIDSIPISNDVSELPSSFLDAIERAGRRTPKSSSDEASSEDEVTVQPVDEGQIIPLNEEINVQAERRTLRIFFPDMGAAVLARRDWKMGSADLAEVPPCVETANIQNDPILPSDRVVVILCPQPSEVDYVDRVIDISAERNIPCIIINPTLINMDQGFGVRARNIRNNILGRFTTTYKLKTMPTGAVVREWPAGYSVWNEDASNADGYRLLQSYVSDPTREILDTLYDAANPPLEKKPEPSPLGTAVKGIVGYFQGLSKM